MSRNGVVHLVAVVSLVFVASIAVFSTVPTTLRSEDVSSTEACVWQVNGAGVGAIKYNRATGNAWILEKISNDYVWIAIREAVPTASEDSGKNSMAVRLIGALLTNISVEKDSTGVAVGMLIGKDYTDPGVGLKPGDSIRSIAGMPTTSLDNFMRAVERGVLDKEIKVVVKRDKELLTFVVEADRQ